MVIGMIVRWVSTGSDELYPETSPDDVIPFSNRTNRKWFILVITVIIIVVVVVILVVWLDNDNNEETSEDVDVKPKVLDKKLSVKLKGATGEEIINIETDGSDGRVFIEKNLQLSKELTEYTYNIPSDNAQIIITHINDGKSSGGYVNRDVYLRGITIDGVDIMKNVKGNMYDVFKQKNDETRLAHLYNGNFYWGNVTSGGDIAEYVYGV